MNTLLKKYPNANWDWKNVNERWEVLFNVEDPNQITIKEILKYPQHFKTVMENYNYEFPRRIFITAKDIIQNAERLGYYMPHLLENENVIPKDIIPWYKKNFDKYFYNIAYYPLSDNPNLTIKDILDNPDIVWHFQNISHRNNKITKDDMLKNPQFGWWWNARCDKLKSITIQDIIDHTFLQSHCDDLQNSDGITIKDIVEHPEFHWNYPSLNEKNNITTEDVLNYPYIPICSDKTKIRLRYCKLSLDRNITIKDILKNADNSLNYYKLSSSKNITMKDVLKYADKPWSYNRLSSNPNITIQDIFDNPDKPWDYKLISNRDDITLEFIEKRLDKIDFEILGRLNRLTTIKLEVKPPMENVLSEFHYDLPYIIYNFLSKWLSKFPLRFRFENLKKYI